MKIRFATRVFLHSTVPVVIVLLASFAAARPLVQEQVREGLRASMQQSRQLLSDLRASYEFRNARLLAIVAGNPSLKACIDLTRQRAAAPKRAAPPSRGSTRTYSRSS